MIAAIKKLWRLYWHWLLLLLVVVTLGTVLFLTLYAADLKLHSWDQYCLPTKDGMVNPTWAQKIAGLDSPGHTAVLIDTSDEIPEYAASEIFRLVKNVVEDTVQTPFLQRVSVYGLPETQTDSVSQRGETWCVPTTRENANELYENPDYVEAEFKRFIWGIRRPLEELVSRDEAPVSPIVETLDTLVSDRDATHLIVISDMLQHTDTWNEYIGSPTSTAALSACQAIRESSQLKKVFLLYLDRKHHAQREGWPSASWTDCLRDIQVEPQVIELNTAL